MPKKSLSKFWEAYQPKWSISPDYISDRIGVSQPITRLDPMRYDEPKPEGYMRFVCMSDTHSRQLKVDVPDGDVLLHAGDLTKVGAPGEFKQFSALMRSLPHKYKVVIPGNHELGLDPETDRGAIYKLNVQGKRQECLDNITDCIFLEDSSVTINGIHIYGSPWQPEFGGWAYNLERGPDLKEVWEKIPSTTDILITHGPPVGHGDLCNTGLRAGCVDLLREIQCRVHPSHHVFGHIHEDPGVTTDGETVYINASTCDRRYRAVQPMIIFDLPIKGEGCVIGPRSDVFNLGEGVRDGADKSVEGVEGDVTETGTETGAETATAINAAATN